MSAATAGTAQVLPFEGAPSSEPLEPRVRHLSRKEQIWIIVEDSTIIGGFIFLVIVLSTVSFVLETEPSMKGVELQGMWFGCASHPYGTAAATPRPRYLAAAMLYSEGGANSCKFALLTHAVRAPLDVPLAAALKPLPSSFFPSSMASASSAVRTAALSSSHR